MLNLTVQTPVLDPGLVQDLTSVVLADPEFIAGFKAGMDSHEETMEDHGSMPTTDDLCQVVKNELDPEVIASGIAFDKTFKTAPIHALYFAGFLAGWTALHTSRVHGWNVPDCDNA